MRVPPISVACSDDLTLLLEKKICLHHQWPIKNRFDGRFILLPGVGKYSLLGVSWYFLELQSYSHLPSKGTNGKMKWSRPHDPKTCLNLSLDGVVSTSSYRMFFRTSYGVFPPWNWNNFIKPASFNVKIYLIYTFVKKSSLIIRPI